MNIENLSDKFIYRIPINTRNKARFSWPPQNQEDPNFKCNVCAVEQPVTKLTVKFASNEDEEGFHCVFLCSDHKATEIDNEVAIRDMILMSEITPANPNV